MRTALQEKRTIHIEHGLDAHIGNRASKRVQADLPELKGLATEFFFVSAHGDSDAGGPGANDNASGVATVLEMARSWKAAINLDLCPGPARKVRFDIWGTEIKSTREYLARPFGGEQGIGSRPHPGVLNFDQAGFGARSEQLNVEPNDLKSNRAFMQLAPKLITAIKRSSATQNDGPRTAA
jgi:hypothetical protein